MTSSQYTYVTVTCVRADDVGTRWYMTARDMVPLAEQLSLSLRKPRVVRTECHWFGCRWGDLIVDEAEIK